MKKSLFLILVLFSGVLLAIKFLSNPAFNLLGFQEKSGLKISSSPQGAQVFLDDELVGQTPYENKDLSPKEYSIKLTSDKASWESRVKLNPGTETIIGRDLSGSGLSSAGEILSLEKGKGVTILSFPEQALVSIDGKDSGKTPLKADLSSGDHIFMIALPGFLTRSIKATSVDGFNLIVNVSLAASEKETALVKEQTPVAKVSVLPTSTGFLRVRDKPSLSGQEIARVAPGDSLELLEEQDGWDKIKLPDGKEGFVSADFVKKI